MEKVAETVRCKMRGCFRDELIATEVEPTEHVKEVFNRYAQGEPQMSMEQLRRFLVEFQGEGGTTLADVKRIFKAVLQRGHRHIANFSRKTQTDALTLGDFHRYLFSADLNPSIGDQVHHDMTAPLSHYFIYTGYKSYLTGKAPQSDCSDAPIINALRRGVRVVELDIWPSTTKNDVVVRNGRSSTTQVTLIKCLRSIKEYAFSASPYPVIIILEDNLSPELRAKVSQMFLQTFGDMIFSKGSELLEFPSPEELKRRIIILTKPSKKYLEASMNYQKGNKEKDSCGKKSEDRVDQDDNEKSDTDMCGLNQDYELIEGSDSESESLAASAYKSLVLVHTGKPKGALKEALKVEPNEVGGLSMNEQALEKAASLHGAHFVRYTQKNLLRICPNRIQSNSVNYIPIGWMHGAQMVSFNMQGFRKKFPVPHVELKLLTYAIDRQEKYNKISVSEQILNRTGFGGDNWRDYGRNLWLTHGMFKSNGGCGYVKKPHSLLKFGPGQVFFLKTKLPVRKILKVKVYKGDGFHLDFTMIQFNLSASPDLPFRVGIAGVVADEATKETKILKQSWTPISNEEFAFPLTVPELAMLWIEVNKPGTQEENTLWGHSSLPVSELKQGIRTVPLHDMKGNKYSSTRLLMRFEFEFVR